MGMAARELVNRISVPSGLSSGEPSPLTLARVQPAGSRGRHSNDRGVAPEVSLSEPLTVSALPAR